MTEHVAPITEKNAVTIGELMDRVELQLADRADELARQGRSLRSLGTLDDLAARMVAALPSVHPWDTAIGPFYDTAGLMLWLGVTRQALADRERRGTLLACRTSDGHLLYPVLQFGRNGQVRPGVVDAVGILKRAGADGWAIGTWLTTPWTGYARWPPPTRPGGHDEPRGRRPAAAVSPARRVPDPTPHPR